MGKINLLSKQTAELIAAGEVVERPSSVIKELVENSIDAGATAITVEIKNGGIVYIRVTDNGSGIAKDDVKRAFLRHATSKIAREEDLNNIGTLGFRGEALAAICAVSKVELLTKYESESIGTRYIIEGGQEVLLEDAGYPKGTTIVVRDLFYNTPARMKFLKKDVAEANAVASVIDRLALSHPEIAFKFIRDGNLVLSTSGDGMFLSAIYSVLGREFASGLIPVDYEMYGIKVSGYVCKPINCRPNRKMQYFFINSRFVKTGTGSAALEQAYKNSVMSGKFPSCVLNIVLPFDAVDVNVHPAKIEVRFADEKRVFDSVYYGVKSALEAGDSRPVLELKQNKTFKTEPEPVLQKTTNYEFNPEKKEIIINKTIKPVESPKTQPEFSRINRLSDFAQKPSPQKIAEVLDILNETAKQVEKAEESSSPEQPGRQAIEEKPETKPDDQEILCIGEAFGTYIIVQMGKKLVFLDKHAAHERIIYEELKSNTQIGQQQLLTPISVTLSKEEYSALLENNQLLSSAGFEIEDFGNGTVLVRGIPAVLSEENISGVIGEIAGGLIDSPVVRVSKLEWIFESIACRAAVKAGDKLSLSEMQAIAKKVLSNNDILYCPHGRAVAFEITESQLKKQFGR
ncbi:MAG TPA: DNA mismatch repair endonuclease MutL [Clostridiales bacterium]|nr:DNA mismatch repair endonuclease MutL [Clostridiales bacterium]